MKFVMLILVLLLIAVNPIIVKATQNDKPIIIFHIDFNSVSLNEEYVRGWLKKAASMGYNAVLWEIENKVKWETCPECVSPDAFSKAEFKNILNYSRELGLEPIPLLQTIGHAEYVLQHEKYKPMREDSARYDCYCTSNPDVRSFLKNWIEEYLTLFGNIRYFHLGGDEAYAFATCSKCKAKTDELGKNFVYAEYVNDIAKQLLINGIRPGVWSDMILKYPADIGFIKKEFIIWDWNYWDGCAVPERVMVWSKGTRLNKNEITQSVLSDFPEIMDDSGKLNAFYTSDVLKRIGYDVILCSSSRSHGDGVFAGRNDIHVENIIGAAKKTIKANLLGNCVTSWAVRVHNFEIQEPWLYLAPLTLKYSSLSKEELLTKASENIFGIPDTKFFSIASQVGYSFPFANENTTGIMWTGMKDSKPAPEIYIMKLIDKWRGIESKDKWNSSVNRIRNSIDTLNEGISKLNEYIPHVKFGKNIINAWSSAGYFQYWQAVIANEIINKAENKQEEPAENIVLLLNSLKKQYIGWAKTWMTPDSAEQNAGLIYDAILDYFSQNKTNLLQTK